MTANAAVALIVKGLPPEAIIPLAIAAVALCALLFAGDKLARWKERDPEQAVKLGVGAAGLLTLAAVVLLVRCLFSQSDPNNKGTGQLSLFDAPTVGFCAAVAASFWRFGNQRKLARYLAYGIAALLVVKPFIWPVMAIVPADAHAAARSYSRGMLDPEHYLFLIAGIVVFVTGLIAGSKPLEPLPPPSAPPPGWPPPPGSPPPPAGQ